MHGPCPGALLSKNLTIRYFRPKEYRFDVLAQDHFFSLHTTRLERIFVKKNELVRTLVNVEFVPRQLLQSPGSVTLILGVASHDKSPPRCLLLCLSSTLHPSTGLRGTSGRSVRRCLARPWSPRTVSRPSFICTSGARGSPLSRPHVSGTRVHQASDLVSLLRQTTRGPEGLHFVFFRFVRRARLSGRERWVGSFLRDYALRRFFVFSRLFIFFLPLPWLEPCAFPATFFPRASQHGQCRDKKNWYLANLFPQRQKTGVSDIAEQTFIDARRRESLMPLSASPSHSMTCPRYLGLRTKSRWPSSNTFFCSLPRLPNALTRHFQRIVVDRVRICVPRLVRVLSPTLNVSTVLVQQGTWEFEEPELQATAL